MNAPARIARRAALLALFPMLTAVTFCGCTEPTPEVKNAPVVKDAPPVEESEGPLKAPGGKAAIGGEMKKSRKGAD